MGDRVKQAVYHAIADIVPHARFTGSAHLVDDLGFDSLSTANLVVAIERQLQARLPGGAESAFIDLSTVDDLVERLAPLFDASDTNR